MPGPMPTAPYGVVYVVVGCRGMYGHFPDTRAQAGPCGQNGGAGHAERARHEQGVAERPLVAESRPGFQQGGDVGALGEAHRRAGGGEAFGREPDVKPFPTADILAAIGHEESRFGELEGEGVVRMDDGVVLDVGIAVAFQA